MDTILDEFKCPITLEIMNDPVLCEDGYTYERTAIMSLRDSFSPMTRQPINKSNLIPNRALKNVIDKFILFDNQNQNHLLEKQKQEKEEKEIHEQKVQQKIDEILKFRKERLLQKKRNKEMRMGCF